MAIEDPKSYLNLYCEELSTMPGMDITKVCKLAKDDLGNQIPSHCFTDYVDNKYKNQSQLKKGQIKSQDDLTKEAKVKRISNWLKKQPKDLVDSFYEEALETFDPEIQMTEYLKK